MGGRDKERGVVTKAKRGRDGNGCVSRNVCLEVIGGQVTCPTSYCYLHMPALCHLRYLPTAWPYAISAAHIRYGPMPPMLLTYGMVLAGRGRSVRERATCVPLVTLMLLPFMGVTLPFMEAVVLVYGNSAAIYGSSTAISAASAPIFGVGAVVYGSSHATSWRGW
eukprot:2985443-Rhodomonas_salina.1